MNGVIAAAMQHAKDRASTSSTDVSENLTPPPRKKSEPTPRKSRLADAPGLEAGSSTTLLEAFVPAPKSVDSDSTTARKKSRARKSRVEASQLLTRDDDPSLASSVPSSPDNSSPTPLPLPKNRTKSTTPLTAPPPNQRAIQKPPQAKARPQSTSSEDEDSDTPKTKPVPISDPDDELDAFLHAPTNSSQKNVLEDLPSHSEDDDDDEVEREDVEMDEEDESPRSKGMRQEQLKVMAKVESSSDDDSESESVADVALVKAS